MIHVGRWVDSEVDDLGIDPRSRYADAFWLPSAGPSVMAFIRLVAYGLDEWPEGFTKTRSLFGEAEGLSVDSLGHAIDRAILFGLVRHEGLVGQVRRLAVRRWMPPVTEHQLRRLDPDIAARHDDWPGVGDLPPRRDAVTLDGATAAPRCR